MNVTGSGSDQQIYLPQMVAVTRKFDRLDTPANRFIKFALHKFDAVCAGLISVLNSDGQSMQSECLEEAKAIHKSLENIFRDGFFDEVGDLDIMPQNNQILQKREGYSQIFSAYSMLDLALQLDWKGKNRITPQDEADVMRSYLKIYPPEKFTAANPPDETFEEYLWKHGYEGKFWHSYEYFCENIYTHAPYIAEILYGTGHFEEYRKEMSGAKDDKEPEM